MLQWVATFTGSLHAHMWRQSMRDTTKRRRSGTHGRRQQEDKLVVVRSFDGVKKRGKTMANSHSLAVVGPFTFCAKCGQFSSQRITKLAAACPRKALQGSVTGLRRMQSGRHPRKNAHLGSVKWLGKAWPSSSPRAVQARFA
eukprot:779781-Karenia_brevis.AAC.1